MAWTKKRLKYDRAWSNLNWVSFVSKIYLFTFQSLANFLPKPTKEDLKKKISSNTPHLVNYNDTIGNRIKGVLDNNSEKNAKKALKLPFDPSEIEMDMLSKSMWTVFTGLPYVSPKVNRERAARLQELLHFCSTPEVSNAG